MHPTIPLPRRARRIVFTGVSLLAAGISSVGLPLVSSASAAASAASAPTSVATALDTAFGGGLVTSNVSTLDDEAFAVAVQPDGATVVAGWTGWDRYKYKGGDILVARYTAAGALDPAFGTGGTVVLPAPSDADRAYAVAVQADGKIVVAAGQSGHPVVIRLTAAGVLDPDFQGGIVHLTEATEGVPRTLALQPDSTIRIGGTAVRRTYSGASILAFQARLLADGARDTEFAPDGYVSGDVPTDTGFTTMALLPDGRLVAAGSVAWPVFSGGPTEAAAIARYLPTGALDTTFGTGGLTVVGPDTDFVDRGTAIAAIAVQPDGRIVAAGREYIFGAPASIPIPGSSPPAPTGIKHLSLGNVAVFRFLADGAPDTAFAGTGSVITRIPGQPGRGARDPAAVTPPETGGAGVSVALAADGSILVGGGSGQPFTEPLVLRYTAGGLLDPSFGRAGVLSIDRGGPQGVVDALAFHADGRLVVAGGSWVGWNEPPNFRNLLVGRVIPGSNSGQVWAWGWNALGQLGDGTTTDRRTPVAVPGLTGVVALSASPYHSLALKGDGTVWAWGWNVLGQLGDGTTVNRSAPVKVPGLTGVVAVAAGGLHSLALKGDGTVWAWGYNGYGQLGDGTLTSHLLPHRSKLTGIFSISAGFLHNLAIREEGSGWAWGYNGMGQLGDGTFLNRSSPVSLPPTYNNYAYTRLAAGWLHSVSIDAYGQGGMWGWDQLGQVTGQIGGVSSPNPGSSIMEAMEVSAGGYHSLLPDRDGAVFSKGWNAHGQLGRDSTYTTFPLVFSVTGLSEGPIVSAGGVHSLAITPDRRLLAWGWNYFGQLGTGTAGGQVPAAVALANPVMVAGGGYHSLAIQG